MTGQAAVELHKRRLTPPERMFSRSPYSIVAVVARIAGQVTEPMLAQAVTKVQRRHANLRCRIVEDKEHLLWLTSEGTGEIAIEVLPRTSEERWIDVLHESSQVPFSFDERPPIRFILIQSPERSDLLILCHHLICDGLSLAYLARDLMAHLGDPALAPQPLPDPVVVDQESMPQGLAPNAIARFFLKRISKRWADESAFFDQQDYVDLSSAYWDRFQHRLLCVELDQAQTTSLVARCRETGVTVNSALTAAFVGAQRVVQGKQPGQELTGVAANTRDRLRSPAGEAMGF